MNQQGSMSNTSFKVRRAATGACSVGMLITWGLLFTLGEEDTKKAVAPVFMRMGIVLAAIWLALPELRGLSRNISGKGTVLVLVALVVASISKASVLPLTVLGVVLLIALGIKRGWNWLWEPLPAPTRSASKEVKPIAGSKPSPAEESSQDD